MGGSGVDGAQGVLGGTRSSEIDQAERVVAEEDLPQPVGLRAWAQADGLSPEGPADVPSLAAKHEPAVGREQMNRSAGRILDGRQGRREAAGTGTITGRRRGAAERLMRPLVVVAMAEARE